MAKSRLDIGDIVAASMQQIIQSDEHKKTFFNKKANSKCCSCDSCNKNCPCNSDCAKECNACVKEKTSAINEVIDLLSKISTVQDELGLTKSSITTMQALATMVAELQKNSGDSNDIRYEDLAIDLEDDKDAELYPEIMALLRQRIDESDTGEQSLMTDVFDRDRKSTPDIFDEISADAVSDIPESDFPSSNMFEDPNFIISPPDSGELPTWGPRAEENVTELPPRSLRMKDSDRLPPSPPIPDFVRNLGPRELGDLLDPEDREKETLPVPKNAFERLNNFLSKQAQDDSDSDFEDEDISSADDDLFEDEDGLEMLEEDGGYGFTYDLGDEKDLVRIPDDKGSWKRYMDLSAPERLDQEGAMLLGGPLDIDPDQLTNEEVYADEDWDLGDDAEDRMIEDIKDKQRDEWDEEAPMDNFFWDE